MLKQPDFFYSQPSTLPKEVLATFYLSTTFGLSFMISSVAPTRRSSFYAYLITKIGNRNLKITFYRDLQEMSVVRSCPLRAFRYVETFSLNKSVHGKSVRLNEVSATGDVCYRQVSL